MQKITFLSFAVVATTVALGACTTPRASTDRPPVEPYTTHDNNTGTSGSTTIEKDRSSTSYDNRSSTIAPTPSPTIGSPPLTATIGTEETASLRARRDAIIDELYGE